MAPPACSTINASNLAPLPPISPLSNPCTHAAQKPSLHRHRSRMHAGAVEEAWNTRICSLPWSPGKAGPGMHVTRRTRTGLSREPTGAPASPGPARASAPSEARSSSAKWLETE